MSRIVLSFSAAHHSFPVSLCCGMVLCREKTGENNLGWLGCGITCWEVCRWSGITVPDRGRQGDWQRSLDQRGHVGGMSEWAPYLKSRLVAVHLIVGTLTALTVDRASSHFLAQHAITHSCLSDTPLCFYPDCQPLDFML